MYYVYLLRSLSHPEQKYVGITQNLKKNTTMITTVVFPNTPLNTCLGSWSHTMLFKTKQKPMTLNVI
jgi:hypothetical protein